MTNTKSTTPSPFRLAPAQIEWDASGAPRSATFDDGYYSTSQGSTGGLAEAQHVFIDGVGGSDLWAERDDICIGEVGFGTGLNFLATWKAWAETAAPGARLHYMAVEGVPLAREDLARALSPFAELAPFGYELLAAYPLISPGFKRLSLAGGRVNLTLMFGDVATVLPQASSPIDAWYLDGFAPDRNPDMWSAETFNNIARLSAPDARIATYSAASHVRRGLEAVNFAMEKAPGFGQKRECLRGHFTGVATDFNPSGKPAIKTPGPHQPWFTPAEPLAPGSTVLVIGGGIAGCAAADALGRAGYKPTIIDRRDRLADEGSGNPTGILAPWLARGYDTTTRFCITAYLDYTRRFNALADVMAERGIDLRRPGRGTFKAATSDEDWAQVVELNDLGVLPPEDMELIDAKTAEARTGVPSPWGGLWFPNGGCVNPRAICEALADGTHVINGRAVAALERRNDQWCAMDANGAVIAKADACVIATGPFLNQLYPDTPPDQAAFPIQADQGQISIIDPPIDAEPPRAAVVIGGYMTAPYTDDDGNIRMVIGATSNPWSLDDDAWDKVNADDNTQIFAFLRGHLTEPDDYWTEPATDGRAALRGGSLDHMPLIGPAPDLAAYRQDFAALKHGVPLDQYPFATYHDGLYLMAGFGARGFQAAPLCADLLVAHMGGTPAPLESDIVAALHPGRFMVRALKRGEVN